MSSQGPEQLGIHSDDLVALNQRRLVAEQSGDRAQALELLRRMVQLDPSNADVRYDLAYALEQSGRDDEAEREYRAVLTTHPGAWTVFNNLAVLHRRQRRHAEARAMIEKAVALNPGAAAAHFNRAQVCNDLGDPDVALEACEQALRLRPGHAETLVAKSRALFLAGRLPEAFALFDVRFRAGAGAGTGIGGAVAYPQFNRPMWGGEDPAGKHFVVVVEQGDGDTIQFVRYLPMLLARGARVTLLGERRLESLLRQSFPGVRVVTQLRADEAFDYHVPILNLPQRFGTTLETIPADVPYLKTDEVRRTAWRERLANDPNLKVGLVWAGSPTHANDRCRSASLQDFAALANVPGVSLFSLQKGPRAGELATTAPPVPIVDLSQELQDYADTSAALEALDLLVSVDTSCAHLAGALARPTWTLLPVEVDWRWMLHRPDTPWYPTMRLFRQETPGDWAAVIGRVARELDESAAAHRR